MNDLIERQAAIGAIQKLNIPEDMCVFEIMSHIEVEIATLPSATPERKKGHWERHNTYHGDDTSGYVDSDWRCSECGGQANINAWCMYDLTDFCPHCGADMRGEQE